MHIDGRGRSANARKVVCRHFQLLQATAGEIALGEDELRPVCRNERNCVRLLHDGGSEEMQIEVRSEQDDLDKDAARHFRHEEMRLV
jgi:hypothetical protein